LLISYQQKINKDNYVFKKKGDFMKLTSVLAILAFAFAAHAYETAKPAAAHHDAKATVAASSDMSAPTAATPTAPAAPVKKAKHTKKTH
jgi:hypothetical protein